MARLTAQPVAAGIKKEAKKMKNQNFETRPNEKKLTGIWDNIVKDWRKVTYELLSWLNDDEIGEFARDNDWFDDDEEEEDDEE